MIKSDIRKSLTTVDISQYSNFNPVVVKEN